MTVHKKLASNAIYLFLGWFSVTFLSFTFWLIVGKMPRSCEGGICYGLPPEDYGIVSTSLNLIAIVSNILMLGFDSVLSKLIPEYLARKKTKFVYSLIKFSFKISWITTLMICLALIIFSSQLSSYLKFSPGVLWIVIGILFILPFARTTRFIVFGFQNMKKLFFSDFFAYLIRVLFTALLIFMGLTYFGPLIATGICFFIMALLRIDLSWFSSKSLRIKNKKWLFTEYAFPALIGSLAWVLFNNTPYIILTFFKNTEITGIFTVAMILSSLIVFIPGILTKALFPITSQLSVNRNMKKKQVYLINLVLRYNLFTSLPLALFLIFFSKSIIIIFSSRAFLSASQLFPILTFASLIYGCGNLFLSSLYAIGETKPYRNILILSSLSYLFISIPLTYFFSAKGISFAYGIATLLLAIFSFFSLRKRLHIKLPYSDMIKLIIATIFSLLFLLITTKVTEGILINIILVVFASLIYLVALSFLKFYKKEDRRILEFLAKKSPILKKQLNYLVKFFSKLLK